MRDQIKITSAIWDFFSDKFNEPMRNRPKLIINRFKKISCEDREAMTISFFEDEIKDAVWCCGSDKASDSDGFTFNFLEHY